MVVDSNFVDGDEALDFNNLLVVGLREAADRLKKSRRSALMKLMVGLCGSKWVKVSLW